MNQLIKTLLLIQMLGSIVMAKSIHYTLSMPEPHTHLFDVEMHLERARGKEIVALPVWTPGSYLIREYAKNVQDVSAVSQDGSPLSIHKIDKNHWQVQGKGRQDILVRYRVYAFEHSVRTAFLDADHALVVPAAVFMYWQENENREHKLHVNMPEAWSTITTALKPFNVPGNVDFVAENYDVLADSPLELGNQHEIEFEVLGIPHLIGMYGASNYVDSVLVQDFTKIIEAEAGIFGGLPYDHYAFIIHAEQGYGGLEHSESSVNFIGRWSFTNEKRYKTFLGLISHEFFHVWNVKRIYPQGIAEFDYDAENYMDELWVAEGFTSYYDELILGRTGIKDRGDYLDMLTEEINSLEKRNGKLHQSVTESSWDAWIKYYRTNENSHNSTISYYNKGHLLGLLLDLIIINGSEGQASLDDVMLKLYRDFAQRQKGYTTEDVQKACESFSGTKLDQFFADYVKGLEPLPYAQVLSLAGLDMDSTSEKSAYMGTSLRERNGKLVITRVYEGSPAWSAGLNVNDELVAIDGFRSLNSPPEYLGEKVPGDRIVCTVARNGVLKDIQLTLGYKPVQLKRLQQTETPSDQQKLVFEKWLGLDWNDKEDE